MIYQLAENGLIHSDFNEYNLMVDSSHKVTMIDFPQMVSSCHLNANFYYQRDIQGILTYFSRQHGFADLETEQNLK
jgi:RIO kinase 2